MKQIQTRVRQILTEVAQLEAELASSSPPGGTVEVELAVKTRTVEQISAAATALLEAGRPALLAHNRVQEAAAQVAQLRARFGGDLQLSLIGPLQSNKVNQALRCFDVIETVASLRLAAALSQRLSDGQLLPVFIQVNTSGEETKSGVSPTEAISLARSVAQLPHLQVRGFMTIGAHTTDYQRIRRSFAALRELRDEALDCRELSQAGQLSMGMSSDFRLAIAEGATRIRVGSTVFGARPGACPR